MDDDKDPASCVLGETAGAFRLHDRSEIQAASASMAAQAVRELRIFSRDLDPWLYDKTDFLESVRQLALRSPRSLIEILVLDTEPAIHHGHRLVELARQLTSRIQIRCPPEELRQQVEAYLIADDKGYVLRPLAEVFEGVADFSAPMQVRRMRKDFDDIWERSSRCPELITFGRGL